MKIEKFESPDKQTVCDYVSRFQEANKATEDTIAFLIREFPKNINVNDVQTKVKVINALYSTQIRAVQKATNVILKAHIDSRLEQGDPTVVDDIATITLDNGNLRRNYSFATKYCAWHQPDKYPMFDSNVEYCLLKFQDAGFPFDNQFSASSLRVYEEFLRTVGCLREKSALKNFSLKQTDIFLYRLGEEQQKRAQ